MAVSYLTNQFLIAMPGMTDPNFARTVTLVCDHGPQGALGIVINRALDMSMGEVFEQLGLEHGASRVAGQTVLRGGPVQTERGFVLHTPDARGESTMQVSQRLNLTTSRDILDALARGEGPERAVIALGYAGWDAGQLEEELAHNAWLTVTADERLLFDTPIEERWHAAGRLLGVDLMNVSSDAGHA
jgi:putative transcriptional regulator